MPGNGGSPPRVSVSPAARVVTTPPPAHYLHELPAQDEERLERLFQTLDLDGNGRIDVHDLSHALREAGVHSQYAQKFMARSDSTKSGDLSLAEFIHYIREHEKNLRLQFSNLDKNRDGNIDLEELIRAFKELGIEIAQEEATKLLQRMDQDGSLKISFDEWRDFLLYAPSTNLLDIIEYWHHTTIACKVHTMKRITATPTLIIIVITRIFALMTRVLSDVREARAGIRGKKKNRPVDKRSPFWWGDIYVRISLVLAFLVSLAIGLRALELSVRSSYPLSSKKDCSRSPCWTKTHFSSITLTIK